jgi:hypothetical protein
MKNPSEDFPAKAQTSGTPGQSPAVATWGPNRHYRVLERPLPQSIPTVTVPSKSLSTQQLIEWLARSPFASPHLRQVVS